MTLYLPKFRPCWSWSPQVTCRSPNNPIPRKHKNDVREFFGSCDQILQWMRAFRHTGVSTQTIAVLRGVDGGLPSRAPSSFRVRQG
jgi:hypothetical protein